MYRSRLSPILKAQYSAQDVAFALQHNKFADYQRELTRANASILPRKRASGPGGGRYKYPHVVELAFQMQIGAKQGREFSRMVFWGLLGRLSDSDTGLKKINALPQEERDMIWHGHDFEDAEFPAQAPKDLAQIAAFPQYFFDDDFISRDPEKPTFLTYEPQPIPGVRTDILLLSDMPVSEAKNKLLNFLLRRAGSEGMAEIYREQMEDFALLDLTAMLNRLDRRLKLRLDAQKMRGDVADEDEGAAE